ncbi:DUF72 domain-containing protein [Cohnella faecalis]|uniref:DUF72 domain-containing protein n=1 Tax=Cohnella faecalis TaxID=2315694 RepID=A0A398CMN2_9BACL|nr:DUF72 domain-containing protein [Cohnella faecalis]RIE02499.1 DUF72 domain-containing protein [Cohnella faecalis]
MISIGLAGWGDHDKLYPERLKAKDKLKEYSRHFSTVEVDSSFYAIQPSDRFRRWAEETPDDFRFVVKAYQGLTGHQRGGVAADQSELFGAFRESLQPVLEAGKLTAALFQYPPWFDCTRANVEMLKEARKRMEGIPCALEFRHQSWFRPEYREKTLAFMAGEDWIHSVCDEPQAGEGSVPTVLQATNPGMTIVRMHGRNMSGWSQASAPNWREVRYLYRYGQAELEEWRNNVLELAEQSRDVCVIFNNNSGGDAAENAKQLMAMLGQEPIGFPEPEPSPEQLDLFDL